ncbi:MAG: hypothetical protein M1828_004946 [Chrysothrix sp. TS-e1954]|nr:MAG: hypothetical protein M1828_004946 [Chrysothrix sp. TS-e1954]
MLAPLLVLVASALAILPTVGSTPLEARAPVTNPSAPVVQDGFADPRSIKVGDTYYAFATNHFKSDGINAPVATSQHFSTGWSQSNVNVLQHPGQWTYKDSTGNAHVWDPAVAQYGPNHFVMYYAAFVKDGVHCIGVATSDSILGAYKPSKEPLICPGMTHHTGAISPNPFQVGNDKYLVYKQGGHPNAAIYIQLLSSDGASLADSAPVEILHQTAEEYDTEGPTIVRNPQNQHFVLLYVTGFYKKTSYAIQYASSSTLFPPKGEQYKRAGPPLLATGKTNGVQLYAPGGPDFPNGPHEMTFMTWDQSTYGKRIMRTANVTYTADDVLSIKPAA